MRQGGLVSFSNQPLRTLHDAMAARVEAGQLPGMVTLLAHGDDVRFDAIGTSDLDAGVPMGRDTIFRVASFTKPVLAVVTMMLVEDGTLKLAEPVRTWLPELAEPRVLSRVDGPLTETVPAERPITVEDLLTFRMGFGHITEPTFNPPYPINVAADELGLAIGPPEPRTPHDPDEWIRRFASLPLMDQPGSRWRYNVSAMVLGVLVARAGGAPLGEVMRARLFDPVGMVDTGFVTTPENTSRMPPTFMGDFQGGPVTRQSVSTPDIWTTQPAFPNGAGGLLSTVDDFLALARLLRDRGVVDGRRLLAEESVAALTTNHLTPAQLASAGMILHNLGWGYGLAMAVEPDDASSIPGRYGWDGGYGTTWFNDPHRDLIAMALSQTSDFLFNGGAAEFTRLALATVEPGPN
jgi:CubicO group peptidase (beta-lactamase class C family)